MAQDSRQHKPIVTVLLAAVWLAVVLASVFLVLTRREAYGAYIYIVPCMAVFMLIIFVTSFLPRKTQRIPLTEVVGRISVIALICFALATLGYAIVRIRAGAVTKGVLIVFFIVFVRILMDYIRHCRKPKNKPKKGSHKAAQDDS